MPPIIPRHISSEVRCPYWPSSHPGIIKNGLKTTDISRILHLPPSAITPVINHLEEKGMVRRQSSPDDRRIIIVTLTEKGTALFEKKQAFFFEKALQLVDYLGEEEAKEFLRLFNKSFDFLNNSFKHPE